MRETDEGEIINFDCRVDSAVTVEAAHNKGRDVDHTARNLFPTVMT